MDLMRSSWVAPQNLIERLTPAQFRALVAGFSVAVFGWDFLTELPVPLSFMVVIGFTFWSTDRWMPMATALTSSALILGGLASPIGEMPLRQAFLLRAGGVLVFIGSGWLITRHRALLSAAGAREAVLRTIFDSEPACVKMLGPGCVLLDMNQAGLDMVESPTLDAIRGHSVLRFVVEEYRDAFARLVDHVFGNETGELQFEIIGLKGTRRWMDMRAAPLRSAAGEVTALLAVTNDITDQRRAEAMLRDGAQRLEQAADLAGLGFFEHNHQTDALYWSDGARRIFGVDASERWTHERTLAASHPDDRESTVAKVTRAHDPAGGGLLSFESRIVRPSGEVRHVSVRSQTHFGDLGQGPVPLRTVGTLWDVTVRKQAEAQREALALRVLEAQENERRAVARDLHDEIGQALSALKLNLLRLRREGGGPIVTDSLRIADEVLRQVRDIALSLRPSILDDLGLGAAVQWYAEQTAARANLALSCEVDAHVGGLSPATEIACFRVLQEALTNVVRHAVAKSVLVQLSNRGNYLELVVRDDGRGFDVDDVITHAGRGSSMGLLGIRERAALLGGVTTVTSTPSVGCEVRVHLPRVAHDRALAEAIA